MDATQSASSTFKRGEGYFALRNIQDISGSGLTMISHPKAKVSAKGLNLVGELSARFEDLLSLQFNTPPGLKKTSLPKTATKQASEVLSRTESLSSLSSVTSYGQEKSSFESPSSRAGSLSPDFLKPLKVKPTVSSNPYETCYRIKLYNGKPDQYWYYYRIGRRIELPPKVPQGSVIQEKALFVCDVVNHVDGESRCVERQVWINNGKKKVDWVIAQGASAVQEFDGRKYAFYISDEGPRWVQKKSLSKMKRNHSSRYV